MIASSVIQKALSSRLLIPQLLILPSRGATDDELRDEEGILGRKLCPDHVSLLRQWNGIGLEVIRLFGCGREAGEVGRLANLQLKGLGGPTASIVIGSDASGFVYCQASDSRIFSVDTDGGRVTPIAVDVDDLFTRVVFGPDAASSFGDDWLSELIEHGLVQIP